MNTVAIKFSNISATPAAFNWRGGPGTFTVKATGYGTVKLKMLLPDNVTWVSCGSNTDLSADGGGNFDIGPGQLQVEITTATAVYAAVVSRQ